MLGKSLNFCDQKVCIIWILSQLLLTVLSFWGILFLFDIGIGDGYSPCAFFSWPWSAQEDIATGAWSGYFKEHSRGMDVNQEIWI